MPVSLTNVVYREYTAMYVCCTRSNVNILLNVLCCFSTNFNVVEFVCDTLYSGYVLGMTAMYVSACVCSRFLFVCVFESKGVRVHERLQGICHRGNAGCI